jgi:predicted RNA binding protein YcfA (HicA-like mRNA interferase family)
MPLSSNDLIRLLKNDGWYHVQTRGSHQHFKHPTKSGKMTIPHPKKDLPQGTTKSILKQAGLTGEKL